MIITNPFEPGKCQYLLYWPKSIRSIHIDITIASTIDGFKTIIPEGKNAFNSHAFQYHDGVEWKTVYDGNRSPDCCYWEKQTFSHKSSKQFRLILNEAHAKGKFSIQELKLLFLTGEAFMKNFVSECLIISFENRYE